MAERVPEVQVIQQPPDETELERLRQIIRDLEAEGNGKAEIARLNRRIEELLALLAARDEEDARRRREKSDEEAAWRAKLEEERRRAEEEANKLRQAKDALDMAEKLRQERDEAKRR